VSSTSLGCLVQRVRLAGIDAPELAQSRCLAERALALKSRDRPQALLTGGAVTIVRQGCDRYRRTLATVRAGGRDLGEELIRQGLARRYDGGKQMVQILANELRDWARIAQSTTETALLASVSLKNQRSDAIAESPEYYLGFSPPGFRILRISAVLPPRLAAALEAFGRD
jgi:endonuclease YncB( thermonuclease family)